MHSNTQNGRQAPPQQTAPPTDPRIRNQPPQPTSSGDAEGVCRDFIWGICKMNSQCKYRHEFEYDAMKAVLKFCHDHQNRTGCSRPDCTYLHTSREEEIQFLNSGIVPKVLSDRYSNMSENVPNVPPHNGDMGIEYLGQRQPPLLPLLASAVVSTSQSHSPMLPSMQASQNTMQGPSPIQNSLQGPIQGPMLNQMQGPIQGPMQVPMQGPMQGPIQGPIQVPMQSPMPVPMQGPIPVPMQSPMHGQMQGPMQGPMQGHIPGPMPGHMQGPIQGLMPPPPPPPPPTSVSSTRMVGPVCSPTLTSAPQTMVYHSAINVQSTFPPSFDPTRPPPPIPQATTTRGLKRTTEDCEVGSSKLRKTDSSNDSSCECCVQRLLRVELNSQHNEKIHLQNMQTGKDLTNRMEDYDRKKQLLKSVLSSDVFRYAEEYIDTGSPSPFSFLMNDMRSTSPTLYTSPVATAANSNNNMMHQLVDLLMGNNKRETLESMPSRSADELSSLFSLIESLPSPSERLTPSPDEGNLNRASTSNLANSSNGYHRFLSDNVSPPRLSDPPRLPLVRPYGNMVASAATAAGSATNPQTFSESVASPAVVRPYLENGQGPANAHPYGDSAMGLPGPMYGGGMPRMYPPPAATPRPQMVPRQYAPAPCENPAAPANVPGAYSPNQPPNAPFYGHYPNNMPNPPFPGVVMNHMPRLPMPPQNAQNAPFFMGGRYPNQYYFPPYQ